MADIDLDKIGDPVTEEPRDFPPIHDANVDKIVAKFNELVASLEANDVLDATQSTNITSLSSTVSSIQAQIDALDNIYATDTDILSLQAQIDQLQLQIDSLDGDGFATDTELQAVSASLQGQINSLDMDYATDEQLNTAVASLSASIAEVVADTKYTNSEPSIAVGGVEVGTTFSDQSVVEMFNQLLYPELDPSLVAPSLSFGDNVSNLQEVGDVIVINFTANFDRGSITPDYNTAYPYTNADRSGAPTTYNYTGTSIPALVVSISDTDVQNISAHTVSLGQEQWQCSVDYLSGGQPLTSKDNNFGSPLSAGTTSTKSTSITGVYAVYATTVAITTLDIQSLASMSSTYIQTDVVAETAVNKQTVDFPDDGGSGSWDAITGIQFYNTVSSSWEWIGGSKANSLLTFTSSVESHNDAGGDPRTYIRYTHNGATIGARQLRWYTT